MFIADGCTTSVPAGVTLVAGITFCWPLGVARGVAAEMALGQALGAAIGARCRSGHYVSLARNARCGSGGTDGHPQCLLPTPFPPPPPSPLPAASKS